MIEKTHRRGRSRRGVVLNRAVHYSIEQLEQRLVFSVFTVTSLNDSGAGSLRAQIAAANAATGSPNTIAFASSLSGGAIGLMSVLEVSAGNLTIQGPGSGVLTVDGADETGIFQTDSGVTANISGLQMSDGMANFGAAITNEGTLTVNNCELSDNTASIAGGAIFNSGTLTLIDSTLDSNSAPGAGGISNDGPLDIEGCAFVGNFVTTDGGGIATNTATVSIVNSTFDGNDAIEDGGAIFASFSTTMTISSSTIVGNSTQTGGGIDIGSNATDVTIYNTIVASNQTIEGDPSDITGTLDANLNFDQSPSSHNLIGTGGSGGLTNGSDGNIVGTAHPGLGTLGNNGGPTQTVPLLFLSPAIGAGNPALATDISGHPLLTDQRGVGFPREVGNSLDIGAFEIQPTAPTVIFVDKSATGSNNGVDFKDAFTSLDSALQFVASEMPGGSVDIDVAAGTYVPAGSNFNVPDFAGVLTIQGGFAPGGSTTPNPGANVTKLSGGGSVTNILLDNALDLTLNGLTITGGKANSSSAPNNEGGGVNFLATSGTLTVMNCNLMGNTAAADGGAIYVTNAGATLLVSDSTFSGNSVSGSSAEGGAIDTIADSSTVTDCSFSQNSAEFGAGINAQPAATGIVTTLTLSSDTFNNNSASDSAGAVQSGFGNVVEATDCTFTSNSGEVDAGAVELFESPGVYQSGQGFVNCVFTQNTVAASTSADASALGIIAASPSIINCTFTANVAHGGPAIADSASASPTITNSILFGDGSTEIGNDGTSSATITFSDVQGGTNGTDGNINANPDFVNPPTGLQLQGDSPCINTGSNSAVPAGVTTDLAGNTRIFNTTVDMGAFEFSSSAPRITSADSATFTDGTAGSFTVTTSSSPAADLSNSTLLPKGVTFVNNNNGTATISGTPDGPGGEFFLLLTADNGVSPNATQTFTLTVNQDPSITSASAVTFASGIANTFTFTTGGFPESDLSESGGLPDGVTFVNNNDGTATLAGTPDLTANATFPLTIVADDGMGGLTSQSFMLSVELPTITQTNGVVTGDGTDGNDTATVSYSNGNVIIVIDGDTQTFAMTSVGSVLINLGAGNDSITITSSAPAMNVNGGAGNDTIDPGNNAADTLAGGSGNDLIEGGGPGSLLTGNGGNDSIVGGSSNQTLKGNGGNDTITSIGGNCELLGGAGDDLFLDFGAPTPNQIDGGTGLNFAQNNPKDSMANIFQLFDPPPGVAPSVVTNAIAAPLDSGGGVSDSVNGGVLKIAGSTGNDTISVTSDGTNIDIIANGAGLTPVPLAGLIGVSVKGKGGDDVITIGSSIVLPATLKGNGGNDALTGGGGDNVIIGGSGNDTLVGGAGMNLLVPGNFEAYSATSPGNDSLAGGSGYSIADFSYRTDGMFLSNDGKADSGDSALGETTTIATNIAAIWGGTGNDTIVGTHGGEFLSGGHGADSITGGGAGDLLVGGKNKDTLAVAAEPVTLYLRDNKVDEYSGIADAGADILVLDSIDQILA